MVKVTLLFPCLTFQFPRGSGQPDTQELLLDMERNREMPAFDTMWRNLAGEVEQRGAGSECSQPCYHRGKVKLCQSESETFRC